MKDFLKKCLAKFLEEFQTFGFLMKIFPKKSAADLKDFPYTFLKEPMEGIWRNPWKDFQKNAWRNFAGSSRENSKRNFSGIPEASSKKSKEIYRRLSERDSMEQFWKEIHGRFYVGVFEVIVGVFSTKFQNIENINKEFSQYSRKAFLTDEKFVEEPLNEFL